MILLLIQAPTVSWDPEALFWYCVLLRVSSDVEGLRDEISRVDALCPRDFPLAPSMDLDHEPPF